MARLLFEARCNLRIAQVHLHTIRSGPAWMQAALPFVTEQFYRCLDRVWELQCMCEGRL